MAIRHAACLELHTVSSYWLGVMTTMSRRLPLLLSCCATFWLPVTLVSTSHTCQRYRDHSQSLSAQADRTVSISNNVLCATDVVVMLPILF